LHSKRTLRRHNAANGCGEVWGAPVLLLFGAMSPGPLPGVSLFIVFFRIVITSSFYRLSFYRYPYRSIEIGSVR